MKTVNLIIIATYFLVCVSYSSSKYVNYLKNNTEVVDMKDSLQFKTLNDDFYNNKLFLVGEIHEVESSPRIDFAMFTQLNENINIDVYLLEMDLAKGYYLQKFLEGSDDIELKEILERWPVFIGRISEKHRAKWMKMRAYYSQLTLASKFKVIGIDKIADFGLVRRLLIEKLPKHVIESIPTDTEALISWSNEKLSKFLESGQSQLRQDDLTLLRNIQYNLSNYNQIKSRDQFMYKNFKRLYFQNKWEHKNIYGAFGFAHTLQAYNYTMAGRIKKDSILPYTNNMVSMNTMYVDSHLTVQSMILPKFMQDKGNTYTRFKYSQDNRLLMYIKGIADYKKVTKPNSISLIRLDEKNSPYLNSTRGT
ncbi:hypothetical protein [Winogradskyella forsetii]|uniref:hypothetical protein n=1 Tax=Winogradskyella forsetii TaxID=2686077 RepID=UPI0015B9F712|nr:hypothetical protein [Winogradskyella forsetii]